MSARDKRRERRARDAHAVAAAKAEQARLQQEIADRDHRIALLETVNVEVTRGRDEARAALRDAKAATVRAELEAGKLRDRLADAAKERTRLHHALTRADEETQRAKALAVENAEAAAEANEWRQRAEKAERRLREKATRPERAQANRKALGPHFRREVQP